MGKDTTGFRKRFNAYKNGKSVSEIYDAGLPRYAYGTASIIDLLDQDQLDTLHYIHNYFSDRGMGLADISGIMANIFKESSFRDSAKDSAGYHGYVQMSPDMLTAVMNAYGNLDRDTQLLFILDLITGNSRVKGYTNGFGYKYGLYKTGGDAAEAFRSTFERNKAGRQQSRIDYGNLFYDYLSNLTAQTALQKQVGEQPMPIVEKPDAVIVRKTIPKAKTRARWTGAENVSPYLTNKPILKLKKEIKFPTAAEMHKESLWKAPMLFKDGKLPGYKDGTKYLWDDLAKEWDRYTGDENGSVFADIVVTPRGAAHKKDVQPVQIVTPDQEEYVRRNLPTVSTNSTWHYTPQPSTFVGRVAQAFGGDWKEADIASAAASLKPELSIPLGVMDFGYNLNQSVHDLTDVDTHANTALSAAAILPFVGGLKLLRGKDVGTRVLNAYNNYMHSLGNTDDVNNALKNIRYLDSATDAAPAIKATGENPFKYGEDALKTMDLFNKMRSLLIRGKLAQIRPQQPDLVNDPYGIRDLANDVIHYEGMPEGVEDIFRYQILPRTNISKMNYDNTIDVLSRYGYNTLDDYNWAKYVDDNLAGYLDNSTLAIALREPHIRYAAPHEFRHRMLQLVKDKPSLAIDRKSYLDDAYGDDFVNLPNAVDLSDHLFGYPHIADEAATTNLDSRIYAFSNFTDNPNIGKMSVVELNKFLDSLSDDLIIEAVANSNGYGRRYIPFLEKKYDILNNLKTKAQWANKFRNAMKYYGSFALPAAVVASLPEYSNGKSPIHIKPSKRGTFTAAAKKHGASVREFESRVLKNPEKYSTAMVKKARFSRNARSWKH